MLILAGLGVAACATPEPVKKELSAQEIVDRSSEKMEALKSLHFRLEVLEGKLALGPGISVDAVEGDAAVPGRIRIKTKTTLVGMSVDVEFISVDGKQYLRNPLTKRWDNLPVAVAPASLFDRERGATSIMKGAKNLTKLPDEVFDGTESYHISGSVEPSAVSTIIGGVPSEAQVPVEAWIGTDDFLLRQIRLEGPLVQGDSPKVVRVLKLSKFDEPVNIEPPA
ncbi:MAG: LppX_LprAFG lipoprotein [Chloroflexi bacterium]|nr:LppX_LprAFG lipoprotein [Chloroflexota bacterium]